MKRHVPTLLAVQLAACAGLAAQSADNFDSGEMVEQVAREVADQEAEESTAELVAEPSRYAGIHLESYVRTLAASFAMRNRSRDPFARHQDPNYQPPQPKITKRVPSYKPEPVTPFPDIVAGIQVTTVIPAQNQFLVGDRTFRVGDRINLNTGKDKMIPIHVLAVRANSIEFRHGNTNETAELRLDLLPDGLQRGAGLQPPGVVPANSNAPLEITPVNGLSSSR